MSTAKQAGLCSTRGEHSAGPASALSVQTSLMQCSSELALHDQLPVQRSDTSMCLSSPPVLELLSELPPVFAVVRHHPQPGAPLCQLPLPVLQQAGGDNNQMRPPIAIQGLSDTCMRRANCSIKSAALHPLWCSIKVISAMPEIEHNSHLSQICLHHTRRMCSCP